MCASPALLTRRVVETLIDVQSTWTHIDDILVYGNTYSQVWNAIRQAVRALHVAGFQISCRKSMFQPTQVIKFCGFHLDGSSNTFDIVAARRTWHQSILQTSWRCHPRVLGYLMYWLSSYRLSSAFRFLLRHHPASLWRILQAGPFPFPRPPERTWASGASLMAVAVVDEFTHTVAHQPARDLQPCE